MELQEQLGTAIGKWAGFITGTGTWFALADSQLGMTYEQQLMFLGVKAVFTILVAFICGFAGKAGADVYFHYKNKSKNK